jgi:glycosyltransferase involved in cell wall biosynthesis
MFYSGVFARRGGIETFTHDLAMVLHDDGVEVSVLCASAENPLLADLAAAGVEVRRVPIFRGCRWGVPDYALFPFALFHAKQADVVIHQKPLRPRFHSLISRGPRHVFITAYRPKEQFPDPADRRRFFSFFDLVLTQAETFRNDLLEADVDTPVEVLPLLLDDLPFRAPENVRDGILRVGTMGRLEPQKNLPYALELVDRLRQELPRGWSDIQLNVHGSGTMEHQIRAQASARNLPVVFHGAYDRIRIPEIIAQNDMFLITSISEGQCIAALEILAGGRPLFAAPVGALPSILSAPERGALLPEDDAATGAVCIRAWLEAHEPLSPERIRQSFLQEYGNTNTRRRYVELLTEVVLR